MYAIRSYYDLEERTIKIGRDLKQMTLSEMDVFWNEAKELEKNS